MGQQCQRGHSGDAGRGQGCQRKSDRHRTAPSGNDISLRAFDGAYGNVLWSAKEQFSPNRGVTLADLDGIGQPYVIGVGSRPPNPAVQLFAYRAGDGELVRAKTVGITPTWLSCAPAVADFRGIGKSDVAFSTWDDRSIVMTDGRSGDVLWQFSLGNFTMSGVAAADIDGDGLPDVIAATLDGYAYALRGKDGTLLWKAPITGGAWSAPVTAALEPNGPPSILITSLSGKLYVLNSRTGETIWTSPGSEAANAVPVTMNSTESGRPRRRRDGRRPHRHSCPGRSSGSNSVRLEYTKPSYGVRPADSR